MTWWIYALAVVGGCSLVVTVAAIVVGVVLTWNADALNRHSSYR